MMKPSPTLIAPGFLIIYILIPGQTILHKTLVVEDEIRISLPFNIFVLYGLLVMKCMPPTLGPEAFAYPSPSKS